MLPLRINRPVRRTITKQVSKWSDHKEDLRIDFGQKCGYCDSFDGFRHTYYEVDHFIPKSLFSLNNRITLTQYDNLVYSCKFCNNNKLSKWPTKDEAIHNDGTVGFVDPCDPDYETHFYRTPDGAIRWRTDLGKWMYSHAFKFDQRERSIVLLWNLFRLKELISLLSIELNKMEPKTKEYVELKSQLGDFSYTYVQYHNELMDFYG